MIVKKPMGIMIIMALVAGLFISLPGALALSDTYYPLDGPGQVVEARPGGYFIDETSAVSIAEMGSDRFTGYVFLNVPIPRNATIDAATLSLWYGTGYDWDISENVTLLIEGMRGAPLSLDYASITDHAATTAASYTYSVNWTTSGVKTFDVTDIVDEITEQYSWLLDDSFDNIALRIWAVAPVGPWAPGAEPNYYDYQVATSTGAFSSHKPELEITWTLATDEDQEYKGYIIAPAAGGATVEVFGGSYAGVVSTSVTQYNTLVGGSAWKNVEAEMAQVIASPGTLSTLIIELMGSPGVGDWYNFTVMKNGAPSGLQVGIAGASTRGSNFNDNATFEAGDTISLECDPTNSPTGREVFWSAIYANDGAQSNILGGTYDPNSVSVTEYGNLMGSRTSQGISPDTFREVMPTNGTLKNLYIVMSEDAGTGGDGYNYTLRVNGADTNLTVSLIEPDFIGNNTLDEVTISAGDIVMMEITPINAPLEDPFSHWGLVFEAETPGESIIIGGSHNDLDTAAAEDINPTGYEAWTWIAAGSSQYREHIGQNMTVKDLYIKTRIDPGVGNSHTFSVFADGVALIPAVVSGAVTTGNSGAANGSISIWDRISIHQVPAGGPTPTNDAYWGFVVYLPPGEGAGGGGWVVTPPPGGDNDTSCIELILSGITDPTIEDVKTAIDQCLAPGDPGSDPEDPNEGPWDDTDPWYLNRGSFKLYLLLAGLAALIGPWVMMAQTRDFGFIAWVLFSNLIGVILLYMVGTV